MLFGTARHFEDKTASLAWQPEREYTSGGWGYVGGKAFGREQSGVLNLLLI